MSRSKAFKVVNNNSAKGFGKLLHVLSIFFYLDCWYLFDDENKKKCQFLSVQNILLWAI